MALNLGTTTRRAAFAAIAAASLLAAFPAAAQQVSTNGAGTTGITVDTDCNKYKPGVLGEDAKCEIIKGGILERDNQSLNGRLSKEQTDLACMKKIKIFLDLGKISRETIIQYGKDRACELAKTLG